MTSLLRFVLQTAGIGAVAGLTLVWAMPRFGEPAPSQSPAPAAAPDLEIGAARLSFAPAVERAAPAVANIFTARVVRERAHPFFNDPFFRHFFGDNPLFAPRERLQSSLGSGVVVDPGGYLLTNNHVIQGADEIRVALRDGRSGMAQRVGSDPDTDLAVLRIDLPDLPVIRFGDSDRIAVGDLVLAIGNPFGVGQTVTMGIVSATGRQNLGISTYENFIQTDAAINPGNSGGALITGDGSLVGINTAIFSRTGGSQGIGFAVPAQLAHRVMDDIVEHGRVIRGWLGVTVQEVSGPVAESLGIDGERGVVVTAVFRGSPAARAGLRRGDVIESIAGAPVVSAYETMQRIAEMPPGRSVEIQLSRGGEARTVHVEVAERPPSVTRGS